VKSSPQGQGHHTLQQETGADIAVDDDGVVGTVTIGAKDGRAVEEARRRIAMILDPPTPEVGATYQGRVVNIAKFGAFVSIMPGRDGLLHISKMARSTAASASVRWRTSSNSVRRSRSRLTTSTPRARSRSHSSVTSRSPKRTLVLLVPVTRTAVIEVTVATEAVVTVIVGARARAAREHQRFTLQRVVVVLRSGLRGRTRRRNRRLGPWWPGLRRWRLLAS